MSRPCKYCGSLSHWPFQCAKRPRKTHPGVKQRKPIRKVGKVTRRWIEVRREWLRIHPFPLFHCHYCGREIGRSEMQLDHKEPRSRHPELRYELTNLVPSCGTCNSDKGSQSHDQYEHVCHV